MATAGASGRHRSSSAFSANAQTSGGSPSRFRRIGIRAPAAALTQAASFVEALRAQGSNVIVESNRVVQYVKADVLLFVVDPRIDDWKASSALCLSAAGGNELMVTLRK